MLVRLDTAACTGHARCNAVAPEVFPLDDDGYCAVGELEVPSALEQAARDGAASCPERALRIIE